MQWKSESTCREKPPYELGFEFVVREHHPAEDIQLDRALSCMRGEQPGKWGVAEKRLVVTKVLRVGSSFDAQIVVVQEILSAYTDEHGFPQRELGSKMIVAKLYDPHYGGASGTTAAVFHAEVQYMRESAAYRHAAVHHVQHLAPHYYGSWSTCIESEEWPVPSRDVRLILTGYVNGKDMTCLSPRQFSQMERKAIMRQILTAESRFYACDLCHNDLFPRNVLITAPSARLGSSGPPRIVIIDFGLATIGRSSADVYSADDPYLLSERYISPILRWWRSLGETNIWGRWVDWDWNQWLTETFAADKPDITPEMLKWLHPHERNHSFFLEVLERNRVCSW